MFFKYLRYVLRHKLYVYLEGRKLGVGRLQLLKHDLSKFRPDEFLPYARYFYGRRDIPEGYREAYYVVGKIQRDFDKAWLLHQHRNPHHWQYWVLPLDEGRTKVLDMPDRYRREMLADWTAMGRAFGEEDPPVGWYVANRDKIRLAPRTRKAVEAHLKLDITKEEE